MRRTQRRLQTPLRRAAGPPKLGLVPSALAAFSGRCCLRSGGAGGRRGEAGEPQAGILLSFSPLARWAQEAAEGPPPPPNPPPRLRPGEEGAGGGQRCVFPGDGGTRGGGNRRERRNREGSPGLRWTALSGASPGAEHPGAGGAPCPGVGASSARPCPGFSRGCPALPDGASPGQGQSGRSGRRSPFSGGIWHACCTGQRPPPKTPFDLGGGPVQGRAPRCLWPGLGHAG